MTNLFIIHTQYQLILANGIIEANYSNAKNELILFLDFNLTNDLKIVLSRSYERVLYLSGSYPVINEKWRNKITRYHGIIKEIKLYIKGLKYEDVFLIDDGNIPEMLIMRLCSKIDYPKFNYIEDGGDTYFTNTNLVKSGFGKNSFTKSIRKLLFQPIIGRQFYHTANCFGLHPLISKCYILYPSEIRIELQNKQLIEVNKQMLLNGINNIYYYHSQVFISERSIIFFLDKPTTYILADKVNKIISSIIGSGIEKKYNIYYKYHPREEIEYCKVLDLNGIKINQSIPAEVIIESAINKESIIIGTKSTSLYTASKLGIRSVSLINILDDSEFNIAAIFNKLGVETPNDIKDIFISSQN